MAAVEARRDDDWGRLGFGLYCIVNSMPNMSGRRRRLVPLYKFNPRLQRPRPSDDAIEAALTRMAERSQK